MTPKTTSPRQNPGDELPVAGLLALAMTGFICIMTETLPAGLLPQIGTGLHISPALAGQIVTAYALGSLSAAIPLTLATQRWRRRKVLLLAIVGFVVFNSITALSTHYGPALIARYGAGAAAGLAWALLAGYARRMVTRTQQGRALAIAMVGTPIALSLGVPAGTWLGAAVGWRLAFWIMSALTLLLIVWVLVKMPDFPGAAHHERLPFRHVLGTPGVRSVLGVVIAWMLAHNILYTYIVPFVTPAGLAGEADGVLLLFGVAALAGIWLTSRTVDHALRFSILVSLAVFAAVAGVFTIGSASPTVIIIGVAIWGLTFGGAATLLQTALADAAGDGADIALSMNVVAWNSAIAGGGLLGGALLDTWGAVSFPWAVLGLLAIGFLIAWKARSHGFRPGHRLGHGG
ncbi:MFS transporter [Acetobacter oeni]|uniref:MFS transporter n=1 Tax=Acetobacter oeni TaxID=304077 RepID=A0A511XNW7_9PROT|nr:MFS transporter [Acetobacter oeni]MBB3884447.1 putative MFS family arabinose efflux permease [Acetobacter oeni]NHO20391.1 MFS transporter [Acetobacter oeni]GBR01714.1 arabinose efflux permease [Acetobacter oeni LMG 21952]GEN64668.1 MFS transporter [Acetobacter oeni]